MKEFALRTLTSVVFVAVMVAGLLVPYAAGALFLVIMAQSMNEFYRMALGGSFRYVTGLSILACGTAYIVLYGIRAFGLSAAWFAAPVIVLLLMLAAIVLSCKVEDASRIAYVFVPQVIIALPLMCTPYLLFPQGQMDGTLLLSVFIVIWLSDVGAYLVGSTLGQRPGSKRLAPHISPKKSWWGFFGGVICAVLIAAILHFAGICKLGIWHTLALGTVTSIASVFGDLLESLWKRHFGVKDSGKCIPGHGGMYDRFDSSFAALPASFAYLLIFGLI